MKIHPSDEVLTDLLRVLGRADRRLLRHLAGCEPCRSRLAELPGQGGLAPLAPLAQIVPIRPAGPVDYEGVFERSWRAVAGWMSALQRERREAPDLFAELMEHTGEQRDLLLRNRRRFHTWGLLELLVERSLETTLQDADRGGELALLALRLCDLLDTERYGVEHLEDVRARAWANVGNARRIRSDLQGAQEAFQQAWEHLENGSSDLFEKGVLLDLNASLLRAQRRFEDALRFLRRSVSLFLELGERHRAGRSLVNMANVYSYSGRPEQGVPLLHQALELIDGDQEPRLMLAARHNLAECLATAGRFLEAQQAYRKACGLYQSFPDGRTQNRRRWVEGRIARGLGRNGNAEALFLAARDGFLAEGIPYETALVSLDLALLYAEQGRTAELKRLAAEMVPIFTSRQIHREALAALSFFQQAAAAERAGVETVAKIGRYLQKAQHAPDLRFPEEPAE